MGHGFLFLSTFVTLWVILDPPGLLPVFIGLTRTMTATQRNQAALKASLVALAIIAVFAAFGQFILDYLTISVAALQTSGGLLLLIVALQLLMGEHDQVDESKTRTINVAIVPLGTPLLAGPGGIVAMMVAVQHADGIDYLVVAASLVAAMGAVFLFLRFAAGIHRFLRDSGTILLTRIAGVLLAAIAVQMMADGIRGFIGA
ncbi:MAG: MarC family protein [Propionibacteriaceae bacterium]|jgi:multiple antibiotic resistance protein|nr:MarC family protein [Propionibacteriaceae bacterium]